jgi:hypothetical protein
VWKWTFALSAPPALWINVTAAQRPSAMPMPRVMRRVQAKMRRTKMRKVGVASAGSRSSSRRSEQLAVSRQLAMHGLDSQLCGDFAGRMSAHAVGYRENLQRPIDEKSILVDLSMLAYIARTIGLYQHAMPPFL